MQSPPLDRATLNQVRSALATLDEVKPAIEAAMEAGFDCHEQKARHEHYQGLATQILAVYEPYHHKLKPTDS